MIHKTTLLKYMSQNVQMFFKIKTLDVKSMYARTYDAELQMSIY